MVKRKNLFCIVLAFIMLLFTLILGFSVKPIIRNVVAESLQEYEQRNVMDDLKNSTLNGQAFSVEAYPFTGKGNPAVLSLIEYGYSPFQERQDSFNLYVYIYNPAGIKFLPNSSLNSITMKFGRLDSAESYERYPLSYLNMSKESDYLGLYWKFKVVLTEEQRASLLTTLNSSERIYAVSEFELVPEDTGTVVAYGVGREYIYRGYAEGMGPDAYAESTLCCAEDGLESLSLDVHPTYFRPEGSNGTSSVSQDSLHSVYFAVPNDVLEKYGALQKVHATWRDAVMAPVLVTGNKVAFDAISPLLGKDISSNSDFPYLYMGDFAELPNTEYKTWFAAGFRYYGELPDSVVVSSRYDTNGNPIGRKINSLYLMYYSGASLNSADDYVVTSDIIRHDLEAGADLYGGELVDGKYSRCMFDWIASEKTEKTIEANDNFSLTELITNDDWWDILLGKDTSVDTGAYKDLKAIYPVSKNDFSGTPETICNKLCISIGDYNSFKNYYDNYSSTHTVFLFRYQVSEYMSMEATLLEKEEGFLGIGWNFDEIDTNAYFAQQTVNLGFDIIDLTFRQGEKDTVIPVVMTPQDIIHDLTPPLETTEDEPDWWKYLFMVLALIIILILFWPFVSPIISMILKMAFDGIFFALKLIIKILLLPFSLLFGWIFKRR